MKKIEDRVLPNKFFPGNKLAPIEFHSALLTIVGMLRTTYPDVPGSLFDD